jgi:hypothetical protein
MLARAGSMGCSQQQQSKHGEQTEEVGLTRIAADKALF